MKIQNHSLKGATIGLRYTRDDNGRPVPCVGDALGVFEMGDRDAKMLLETPGWRLPGKSPAAPKPKAPTLAATVANGPVESPPPSSPPAAPEEPEEEAPDIAGLRTKAAAQAMAAEWREKGYDIPVLDADTMKLSEMKEALSSALFVEEDEPEES